MYLLRRFCGENFTRINAILDLYGHSLRDFINLIASASYPFPEVVDALANPFHAFPAEGLPGVRYFPRSSPLDAVETHSEELVRKLFRLPACYQVTTQPHSGTQANQVVFNAALGPSDLVLSLHPSHGGHISHTVLVGRRNPVVHYHATAEGEPDYEEVAHLAEHHRPKLIVAGSSSLSRPIDYARLGVIAHHAGALLHADISHTALFAITGHHPSPFPHAEFATFNTMKNLRGPCGGVLIYPSAHHRKVAQALFPGTQGGPIESVLFAKLVCFARLLDEDLGAYAEAIIQNARTFARVLASAGVHVIGDTYSHLILLDLRSLSLTGVEAENRCEKAGVLLNRNLITNDPHPPRVASGLRAGTSCITTLGYAAQEVESLASIVASILKDEPYKLEDHRRLLLRQTLVAPMWR